MKKSEMIRIIGSYVKAFDRYPDNAPPSYYQRVANRILEAIENAGMLPPKALIKVGSHETVDYCWEPELPEEEPFEDPV